MMNYQIEPANEKDIPLMVEMWLDLMKYHHGLDPDYFHDAHKSADLFGYAMEGKLNDPHSFILMAKVGDRKVGFISGSVDHSISLFHDKVVGTVENIYLDDDWRRKGLGGLLIEAAILRLKDLGAQLIQALVFARNSPMLDYMKCRGFEKQFVRLSLWTEPRQD